jgi:hypothetical protein
MTRALFSLPHSFQQGRIERVDGSTIPVDSPHAGTAFAEWAFYWNEKADEYHRRYLQVSSMGTGAGEQARDAQLGFLGTLLGARQALGHALSAAAQIIGPTERRTMNVVVDPVLRISLGSPTGDQMHRAALRILNDVERFLRDERVVRCDAGVACRETLVSGTVPAEALGGCAGMVDRGDGTVVFVDYLPDGSEIICLPGVTVMAGTMGVAPAVLALAPFVVKVIGYTLAAVVVMNVARLTIDRLSQYFGVNADLQEQAADAAQVAYEEALTACAAIKDPAARARCMGDAEQVLVDALARINEDFAGSGGRVMGMVLALGALGLGAVALSNRNR